MSASVRLRTVLMLVAAGFILVVAGFCAGALTIGVLGSTGTQATSAQPQPTSTVDPTMRYRVTLLETLESLGSIEPSQPVDCGVFLASVSPESVNASGFVADWLSTSFTEYSGALNTSSFKQQVALVPVGAQFYILTPERPGWTLKTPHPIAPKDFLSKWNNESAESQQLRESYWWVVLANGRCYALMQAPGYSPASR